MYSTNHIGSLINEYQYYWSNKQQLREVPLWYYHVSFLGFAFLGGEGGGGGRV